MPQGNGSNEYGQEAAPQTALPEITVKANGDWEVSMQVNGGRVTLYPDGIYLEVGRRYEYWPLSSMTAWVQETGQHFAG